MTLSVLTESVIGVVYCLKITRLDGTVIAFTEHDKCIVYDGVEYFPLGATFSALQVELNLRDDTTSCLTVKDNDDEISRDIKAGKYDNAEIIIHYVNWRIGAPYEGVVSFSGFLGESERKGVELTLTFHSLSEKLQRPMGRTYSLTCDANLGDRRCRAELDDHEFTGSVLGSTNNRILRVSLMGRIILEEDYFRYGFLKFTSGDLCGCSAMTIHRSYIEDNVLVLELYVAAPLQIMSGDEFQITAGCDKSLNHCKNKFMNLVNYQGFPWIPGDERLIVSGTECGDENTIVKESEVNQQTGEFETGDGPGYGPGSRSGLPEPNLFPGQDVPPDRVPVPVFLVPNENGLGFHVPEPEIPEHPDRAPVLPVPAPRRNPTPSDPDPGRGYDGDPYGGYTPSDPWGGDVSEFSGPF